MKRSPLSIIEETIAKSMPQFLENLRISRELEESIMADPERAEVYMRLRCRKEDCPACKAFDAKWAKK